jgi:4-hydroxybenzoate polyprenyltransferase
MAWLAFAINDYFDAAYDGQDVAKGARNFFVGEWKPAATWLFGGVAAFILASVIVLYAAFGWRGWVVCALSFLITWAYSAPPLRLKKRPLLDLISHALCVQSAPYYASLFLIRATPQTLDVVMISVLMLSSLAAQLEQQQRDFAVDSKAESNFTVWIGRARAAHLLRALTVLLMGVILLAALLGIFPAFFYPYVVFGLPLLAHRLFRGNNKPRSERLVWLGVLGALLYTAVVWGTFFILGQ